MKVGQRVKETVSSRLGTVASQPYIADNAAFLVVDVRFDGSRRRSTVQATTLRPLPRMNVTQCQHCEYACEVCDI